MTLEPLTCYNKGCGKKFLFEENTEQSCTYHPGIPVFHDALKGWSCCKKRCTDFTEFLNMKGCTTGCHSNVKPPEPEKVEKPKEEALIQVDLAPKHRPANPAPAERPPADEPLVDLKTTVGASLRTQLSKLSLEKPSESAESDVADGIVKVGTSCNNKGCKVSYADEQSNTEECVFHPGNPIFHEGMKYWTCCQRKTSDFDAFLSQEGCATGNHLWHKPKLEAEKHVRMDWHQTPSQVCVSIFTKVAVPDRTCVQANGVICRVELVYEGGNSQYSKTFVLREAIDPARSNVNLLGTKVEINLKKKEAFSWASLELPQQNSS